VSPLKLSNQWKFFVMSVSELDAFSTSFHEPVYFFLKFYSGLGISLIVGLLPVLTFSIFFPFLFPLQECFSVCTYENAFWFAP